jgi:hypothetical protein
VVFLELAVRVRDDGGRSTVDERRPEVKGAGVAESVWPRLPMQPRLVLLRAERCASGIMAQAGRPMVAASGPTPAARAASASSMISRARPRTITTSGSTGSARSGP